MLNCLSCKSQTLFQPFVGLRSNFLESAEMLCGGIRLGVVGVATGTGCETGRAAWRCRRDVDATTKLARQWPASSSRSFNA